MFQACLLHAIEETITARAYVQCSIGPHRSVLTNTKSRYFLESQQILSSHYLPRRLCSRSAEAIIFHISNITIKSKLKNG